jgi:prephenate dehydrogenase
MRIAVLGFGLIGGSIARALQARDPGHWQVAAWSPSGDGPRHAAQAGEIALAAQDEKQAVDGAELVVLAAPPLDCLRLLDTIAHDLGSAMRPDAVVTDVASTKARLTAHADALGIRFVGGHPMAGRERTGFAAADPGLFEHRPWVVCTDSGDDAARLRVEELVVAVGGEIVRMDSATHDAAVAAISHLPLVVAAALVESTFGGQAAGPDWAVRDAARQLAATGWRDMTRLARGDVAMGAGIAVTNADEIAKRVRGMRAVLDGWLDELERPDGPDADRISVRLTEAQRLLADDTRGGKT